MWTLNENLVPDATQAAYLYGRRSSVCRLVRHPPRWGAIACDVALDLTRQRRTRDKRCHFALLPEQTPINGPERGSCGARLQLTKCDETPRSCILQKGCRHPAKDVKGKGKGGESRQHGAKLTSKMSFATNCSPDRGPPLKPSNRAVRSLIGSAYRRQERSLR